MCRSVNHRIGIVPIGCEKGFHRFCAPAIRPRFWTVLAAVANTSSLEYQIVACCLLSSYNVDCRVDRKVACFEHQQQLRQCRKTWLVFLTNRLATITNVLNNGLDRVACDIPSSSTSPPPPPSSPMFKKTSPTSSQSAALNDFETGCQAKDNFPLL